MQCWDGEGSRRYVGHCDSHTNGHQHRCSFSGDITSIKVLPHFPHLACTTSRDYSTRFYDLSIDARFVLPDLPRPPQGSDHFCGPPFGMPAHPKDGPGVGELPAEVEGVGKGKCIGVLWGPIAGREEIPGGALRRTRIGGHYGSVLAAVRTAPKVHGASSTVTGFPSEWSQSSRHVWSEKR
jgi:hypothetical protein